MKKILLITTAVILAVYLIASFFWTGKFSAEETCTGLTVNIEESSTNYVTKEFILSELDRERLNPKNKPVSEAGIDKIEAMFNGKDYVESAECYITNDGIVHLDIVPIKPVMRVFDSTGSYYLNRQGKRMAANANIFIDLPVVTGNFTNYTEPLKLLPMLEYIEKDEFLRNLVTQVEVKDTNNIFIVPNIVGHIINMGTTDHFQSKFAKLMRMYKEVMPVKGWETYDTINLKWDHQIVATKRNKKSRLSIETYDPTTEEEAPTLEMVEKSEKKKTTDN